jgi:hypothetical protein
MRFGPTPGWASNIENGVTKYWMRFTVTSPLTTSPRLEAVRLLRNFSQHGQDGTVLYFGDARPPDYLDVDMSKWRAGSGTAPNTAPVLYSAGVSVGSDADFTANPSNRELGYSLWLPRGLDTSHAADLKIEWYPTTTNVGALALSLYYVPVPAGSILAGGLTGEQVIALTPTPPGVIGQTTVLSYPMALPSLVAGTDRVAMRLVRLGGDAFTGDAIISKARLEFRRWRS